MTSAIVKGWPQKCAGLSAGPTSKEDHRVQLTFIIILTDELAPRMNADAAQDL